VVAVDGVDVRDADPEAVRARIAMVPQETVIFAASARDNLRYGRWDASDEQLWAAAEAANASTFLRALPDGLDTFLGEGGARLSGGQRQRVAIARALLRDADETVEAARRQADGKLGRVRLGTSTGVVIDLLPRVLEALQDSHPGIDVEVAILGSSQALERLALGTLDIGLVALPQPPLRGTVVTPWRDPMVRAFVPASWPSPRTVTPGWLAQQALIFNDATTHMHRLTMAWFADGGCAPRARIELNYDAAIRSLVAAGYGAALLPVYESRDAETDARLKVLPLKPRLVRRLGIAHRDEASLDGSTERDIETLMRFRQE